MRYSVLTFGCRVNQAESLAIEAELRAAGDTPAEPARADLVVVNSCSVTATADQGTRQAIRKIARENPEARIVVTGCYATREPEAVAALPGVARLVPNAGKDALVAQLSDLRSGMTTAERYAGGEGPCGLLHERTAYTLRVQTGCEEACSYCIIPSTRGRSQSTDPEALAAQARRLEASGYRELTLTGVHLGAYGRDLARVSSLTALLERLLAATDRLVFRLGSLEPMDCPTTLVDLACSTDRVAPQFHLPLQHASDRVLQSMRRPYTRGAYAALVDRIRERLPHAALTADVIVGFPGEDEHDAAVLAAYLDASPLTQLHVFPYSDRPGTEASRLPGHVHGTAIRERGARMRAIGQELARRFRASQAGRTCRALTIEDGRTAVADNGLRVRIPPGCPRNTHVTVRLALDADAGLAGELVRPLADPT